MFEFPSRSRPTSLMSGGTVITRNCQICGHYGRTSGDIKGNLKEGHPVANHPIGNGELAETAAYWFLFEK